MVDWLTMLTRINSIIIQRRHPADSMDRHDFASGINSGRIHFSFSQTPGSQRNDPVNYAIRRRYPPNGPIYLDFLLFSSAHGNGPIPKIK
jgi:hypothetical protein